LIEAPLKTILHTDVCPLLFAPSARGEYLNFGQTADQHFANVVLLVALLLPLLFGCQSLQLFAILVIVVLVVLLQFRFGQQLYL